VTRDQGSPLEQQMAITALGNLAYFQGRPAEAWAMVRELLPRGPFSEPEDGLFPYAIEMLRLATVLALDASDITTASDWLQTHDRWLDWSGSIRGRAESRLLQARLHELQGDMQSAEHSGQEALRLASNPRQPLMLLAAHRFLGQIFISEDRIDEAERELGMALDLADACAAPYERASTLLCLAHLYLGTHRSQDARVLLDTAREIGSELEAAPILSMADHLASVPGSSNGASALTSRELEVLRLVASGLTDADAAEQLYISPRTVGQHLRSIYNKLGVSSRTAATSVAIKEDLV
jgi:ATP/maltotriose-dependent transcriptional regulator MalT